MKNILPTIKHRLAAEARWNDVFSWLPGELKFCECRSHYRENKCHTEVCPKYVRRGTVWDALRSLADMYPPLGAKQVVFTRVAGKEVPQQPWPQVFYVSRSYMMSGTVEVRPLTLGGILVGLVKNFIAINWWGLLYIIDRVGFIDPPRCHRLNWSTFNIRFWRVRKQRKLRKLQHLKGRTFNSCERCNPSGPYKCREVLHAEEIMDTN